MSIEELIEDVRVINNANNLLFIIMNIRTVMK